MRDACLLLACLAVMIVGALQAAGPEPTPAAVEPVSVGRRPAYLAGTYLVEVGNLGDPLRPDSPWCFVTLGEGPGDQITAEAWRSDDPSLRVESASLAQGAVRLELEREVTVSADGELALECWSLELPLPRAHSLGDDLCFSGQARVSQELGADLPQRVYRYRARLRAQDPAEWEAELALLEQEQQEAPLRQAAAREIPEDVLRQLPYADVAAGRQYQALAAAGAAGEIDERELPRAVRTRLAKLRRRARPNSVQADFRRGQKRR